MGLEPLRLKILAGKCSDFKQPLTAVRRAGRRLSRAGRSDGRAFLEEEEEGEPGLSHSPIPRIG